MKNSKGFEVGQLWVTKCGLIAEITIIDTSSYWGVTGDVIRNLHNSSFCDDGDEYDDDDGLEWGWNFEGEFDVNHIKTDSDLIRQITEEKNPEYFL